MEPIKSKFPGFIDGLKASNINTNKTSLNEYSEQILSILSLLLKSDTLSDLLKENLKRGEQTIKATVKEEMSPDELLQHYIKFGDVIKTNTIELKKNNDIISLKSMARNYLNIAKFTKDSRVKNLAITIAKDFEVQ